jgi:hypothetical protein
VSLSGPDDDGEVFEEESAVSAAFFTVLEADERDEAKADDESEAEAADA